MALLKQGGRSATPPGKVMTTMGLRDASKQLCYGCGEKKDYEMFVMDGYGRFVCPACAGTLGKDVIDRKDPDDGASAD